MKLTWFGGHTYRIYLDGRIYLVSDGQTPDGVDQAEVAAGADQTIDLNSAATDLSAFDPANATWNAPRRLIDEPENTVPSLHAFGGGVLFLDANEPALLVAPTTTEGWGRFADGSTVILGPANLAETATAILKAAQPELIAIAAPELDDETFASLATIRGRTAIQLLEPGMAIEA